MDGEGALGEVRATRNKGQGAAAGVAGVAGVASGGDRRFGARGQKRRGSDGSGGGAIEELVGSGAVCGRVLAELPLRGHGSSAYGDTGNSNVAGAQELATELDRALHIRKRQRVEGALEVAGAAAAAPAIANPFALAAAASPGARIATSAQAQQGAASALRLPREPAAQTTHKRKAPLYDTVPAVVRETIVKRCAGERGALQRMLERGERVGLPAAPSSSVPRSVYVPPTGLELAIRDEDAVVRSLQRNGLLPALQRQRANWEADDDMATE